MMSVVIPAFNEQHRIGPTLRDLERALKGQKREIIVVCDGTDDTPGAIRAAKAQGTRILTFGHRMGKGGALKAGILAAKGDPVIIFDADGAMPASELHKLIEPLTDCDVAIGTRYTAGTRVQLSALRRVTAWLFNHWIRLAFGLPHSDTQCGYKAFRADAAKDLARKTRQTGFVWDVEMLWHAKSVGMTVNEVPVKWQEKGGGDLAQHTLKSVWHIFRDTLKLKKQLKNRK